MNLLELPVFSHSPLVRWRWPESEAPSLSAAQVAADGSLQGLGEIETQIDMTGSNEIGLAREESFSSPAYSACFLSSLAKL